jgi:hypothetical protein
MEQPHTDKLRRRSMIVAQERVGTARATYQSNGLKCYRPRQAPSDAMSQVETAIDRARRVRSVLRGPSPACFGERLQRRPIRAVALGGKDRHDPSYTDPRGRTFYGSVRYAFR